MVAALSPVEGAPREETLGPHPTPPSPLAPGFLPGVRRHHGFLPHPTGADLLVSEGTMGAGAGPGGVVT